MLRKRLTVRRHFGFEIFVILEMYLGLLNFVYIVIGPGFESRRKAIIVSIGKAQNSVLRNDRCNRHKNTSALCPTKLLS